MTLISLMNCFWLNQYREYMLNVLKFTLSHKFWSWVCSWYRMFWASMFLQILFIKKVYTYNGRGDMNQLQCFFFASKCFGWQQFLSKHQMTSPLPFFNFPRSHTDLCRQLGGPNLLSFFFEVLKFSVLKFPAKHGKMNSKPPWFRYILIPILDLRSSMQ